MLVLAGKTAILWKDVDESQVHVNIGLWLSGLVFHLYEFEKKSKENLIQGNNLLHLYFLSTYYLTVSDSIPMTANSDYLEKLMIYHGVCVQQGAWESETDLDFTTTWEIHFNWIEPYNYNL